MSQEGLAKLRARLVETAVAPKQIAERHATRHAAARTRGTHERRFACAWTSALKPFCNL